MFPVVESNGLDRRQDRIGGAAPSSNVLEAQFPPPSSPCCCPKGCCRLEFHVAAFELLPHRAILVDTCVPHEEPEGVKAEVSL